MIEGANAEASGVIEFDPEAWIEKPIDVQLRKTKALEVYLAPSKLVRELDVPLGSGSLISCALVRRRIVSSARRRGSPRVHGPMNDPHQRSLCWTRLPISTAALALYCGSLLGGCANEMTHQHHTIDYIELAVDDLAAAKRFYGAAFGWSFNDYGPDYAGIKRDGGGEVGGMRQESSISRGGPLVILFSSDLEASVKAVQDAGGKIVKEPFSFPGGRRFQFTDPAGNELAVWSEK